MSSELTIQPRASVISALDSATPARAGPPSPLAAPPAQKPGNLFANPDFRFDAAAGLVVIEFRDNSGKITDTIPSQRQLNAYRTHQEAPQAIDGKTATG